MDGEQPCSIFDYFAYMDLYLRYIHDGVHNDGTALNNHILVYEYSYSLRNDSNYNHINSSTRASRVHRHSVRIHE